MPNDLPNMPQLADPLLLRLSFYFMIVMPFGKKLKCKRFFKPVIGNMITLLLGTQLLCQSNKVVRVRYFLEEGSD